jgi:hypothetical protein
MPRLVRRLTLALVAWLTLGVGLAQAQDHVLLMLRMPPAHARPNADYGGSYGDGVDRAARRRIAAELARRNGLTLMDGWPMPIVGVECFVLAVPADRSAESAAEALSRDPAVAWSEPMRYFKGQGSARPPNDPLFPFEPAAREWRLADLHQVSVGRNVRVAVIDSLIERNHPDLIGQVAVAEDFVVGQSKRPEDHGTEVAGVIAALADNGIGSQGVAPGARLMALRACWQVGAAAPKAPETLCDSLSLAKALDYAISHDAQIINLSLAGPNDLLLGKLIDAAENRRITVVGAYDRDLAGGGFPASHPGVVAVADESWGTPPSGVYSAPGSDVPTTTAGGHWSFVNGSSFAAAHVSGLFALLRERQGSSGKLLVLVGASPGGGAIDACASLLRGAETFDCPRPGATDGSKVVRR